ncbi:recombinase family protein (plasmid) [Roseobacter denitrificans]|uniref:Transposon resolvase n=1 Tax=Roseobacter denitrificans (strain ATCC 33942 / OCh 114) TaxID=375451 RepID=Q07GN4_ROSDO|nr:recombinase family protein [Roseobacter denitrificans]ABI93365.1 transposon resolvase [Roseobacter denitrificans OCh 114]AVL51271.1 recombinase family protein [Roseobacter denitrificans]SFG41418.1 putative DNA-invertase from lambdoid prophage Rac [Roseobacter denitrificans OCh 114]
MSRVFAYARVSTSEQSVEPQVMEIQKAGFDILEHRIVSEKVSGSVEAARRKEFAKLLDKLEPGDTLVVTKLDRLGRNMIDVAGTIEALKDRQVKLHCLALSGTDLTSASGTMMVSVIAAAAQFERDLLIERTQAGLANAKAKGKVLGRRPALDAETRARVVQDHQKLQNISAVAKKYHVSRATIHRILASENA